MKNFLRVWEKGAHSQNLSTKEQAMIAEEIELSEEQLEAASGGCHQFGYQGYGYGQPYGYCDPKGGYAYYSHHHRYHHPCGYDNCSSSHGRPNFGWC